jgi:hypothetical protein
MGGFQKLPNLFTKYLGYFSPKNSKSKDEANTGCNRNTRNKFNHELLASCRTRKKYVKKYIDI